MQLHVAVVTEVEITKLVGKFPAFYTTLSSLQCSQKPTNGANPEHLELHNM
jgi:hypothetical protein